MKLTAFGNRVTIKSELDMIIQLLSISHRNYITIDELLELRHKWKIKEKKL